MDHRIYVHSLLQSKNDFRLPTTEEKYDGHGETHTRSRRRPHTLVIFLIPANYDQIAIYATFKHTRSRTHVPARQHDSDFFPVTHTPCVLSARWNHCDSPCARHFAHLQTRRFNTTTCFTSLYLYTHPVRTPGATYPSPFIHSSRFLPALVHHYFRSVALQAWWHYTGA